MAALKNMRWASTKSLQLFGLSAFVLWLLPGTAICQDQPFVTVSLTSLQRQVFASPNATTYKSIRIYGGRIYIGGKEHLYIQQAGDISQKAREPVVWSISDKDRTDCGRLGVYNGNCYNYIRSVLPYNATHMLLCGTSPTAPKNLFLSVKTNTIHQDDVIQKALCSFDPRDSLTAQRVEVGGSFSSFVATSRLLSEDVKIIKNLPDSKIISSTRKMIDENSQFIGSFMADDVMMGQNMKKAYFVFNENTPDQGDNTYGTRIAQICGNDIGGRWSTSQFTSFLKLPLVCQLQGDDPFRFNKATDITFSPDGIIYATFTSENTAFLISGVCAFKLSDVQSAFHSKQFWKTDSGYRQKVPQSEIPTPEPGMCAYPGMGGKADATSKDFSTSFCDFMSAQPLVAQTVLSSTLEKSPGNGGALLHQSGESFVKVVVHKTTAKNGLEYDVLFVATASGKVLKLVKVNASETRQLAQYDVSRTGISNLLLSDSGSLYVDTTQEVVQIPLANCDSYTASCVYCDPCRMCVLSRDPMCGWNPDVKQCVNVSSSPNILQSVATGNADICGEVPMSVMYKKVDVDTQLILGVPNESPSIIATWYKNESPNPVEITETEGYGSSPTQDGRLEFSSFKEEDYGSYLCVHSADGKVVAKKEIICHDGSKEPLSGNENATGTESGTGSATGTRSTSIGGLTNGTTPVGAGNVSSEKPTGISPTPSPVNGANATVLILVLFLVAFVLAMIVVLVIYLRRNENIGLCKQKKYKPDEKPPQNTSGENLPTSDTHENNSNNIYSNRSTMRYNEPETRKLLGGSDVTDGQKKQVATVTPMQPRPYSDGISYIDETDAQPSYRGPVEEVNTPRKTPQRTKSIPANRIVISLGDDHKVNCNSIRRHPKRGTMVIELVCPDDLEIEGTEDTVPGIDLSFLGTEGENPSTQNTPQSDRVPLVSGNGSSLDTDSDSTLKAGSRTGNASDVTSSAASTPRPRGNFSSPVSQPLLPSSYHTRLRNQSSPRSDLNVSPRWDQHETPTSLRVQPTRIDKSPTSTMSSSSTSSSSTSSADKYVTPPPSPVK